jgi:hypothetical protein
MPPKKPIERTVPKFFTASPINQMLFFWVYSQQTVLQCKQKDSIFAFYKHLKIGEELLPYESATVQVTKMREYLIDAKFMHEKIEKNAFYYHLASRIYYCNKATFFDAQKMLFPTIEPDSVYFKHFGWLMTP